MRNQIRVNEWYCVQNIKFRVVSVKKSNQKFKFDITQNIKVKAKTINNNGNMTDWNENELYLHMQFDE